MDIAFTPALGEAINVPISDCCDEQDTIVLRFTAVLGYQSPQVAEGTTKVQLWSDVASPGVDGWKAYDFEIASAHAESKATSSSARALIRLGNFDGAESSTTQHQLVAWVPVSARNARNFSFTYRIQYASGEIKWLGNYGHDGYAVVTRDGLRGLDLVDGWTEPGRVFTLNSTSEPVSIGGFSNVAEYDIWTFPRDPYALYASQGDGELLLAVPRDLGLYSAKPSYVIHASPGTAIHIDLAGALKAFGSGNVTIHACYDLSRLQALLHLRTLQSGGLLDLRILPEHVMISSRTGESPIRIVLIPLVQTQATVANITAETLSDVVGDGGHTELIVFSPSIKEVRVVRKPFAGQSLSFAVPKRGGEFVISRVYDFGTSESGKESDSKVSFLTPYASVTYGFEGQAILPTPPPSPQIQIQSSQDSFAPDDKSASPTPPRVATPEPEQQLRKSVIGRRPPNGSSPVNNHAHRRGFIFAWLFVWIRYVLVLCKHFLGIPVNARDARVILDKPGAQVAEKESPADEVDTSATEAQTDANHHDGSRVNEQTTPESEETGENDAPGAEDTTETPLLNLSSTTLQPSSATTAVRAFYAELLQPPASPFLPSDAHGKSNVIIILSVLDSSVKVPVEAGTSLPISSFHKTLTVDGNIPDDLLVAKLSDEGHGDPGWSRYMVDFSVSFRGEDTSEGRSKVRIVETTN